MDSQALILGTVLLAMVSWCDGKVYRIIRVPAYDIWRTKRQSHPLLTQARIPEVPFVDTLSLTQSERQDDPAGVPEIADYLTPPPPADGVVSATRQQGDTWDLGFDASDLLVPPADQQYNTLKAFSLAPKGTSALEPEIEDTIQDILQQQDNSLAGSSNSQESFPREYEEERRPEQHGPVYTYVKTDKHGHFKWGVRHGH